VGTGNVGDWNEQVRRLADMLPASAETRFGFSCECGCGEVVALTAAHFDRNGAWAEGHEPATPPDPAASPALG
jgi:hypothetical protein